MKTNSLKISLMILMVLVSLTASAQYPTTKVIKGQEVVIMTVPQAQAIDNKFLNLKDTIKLLNLNLGVNKENLRIANEKITQITDDNSRTKESLKQSYIQNEIYLKEIEKYKKMEFEDKRVRRTTQIGIVAALTVWIAVFIGGMSQ